MRTNCLLAFAAFALSASQPLRAADADTGKTWLLLIAVNEHDNAALNRGVANTIRDAQVAYDNILKEMEFNRVKHDRKSSIENLIIRRLEFIVLGTPGVDNSSLLQRAEDAVTSATQLIEDDANANPPRAPNLAAHRRNMDRVYAEIAEEKSNEWRRGK